MKQAVTQKLIEKIEPYACKEFTGKAKRFISALHNFPHARVMELLPMLYTLSEEKNAMLDLFAGTGFVSHFLANIYSNVKQIDEISEFAHTGKNISFIDGNALKSDDLKKVKGNFDFEVCFAGFHHVLAQLNDEMSIYKTLKLRTDTLKKWKTLLNKYGIMLIVDVPAPDDESNLKALNHKPKVNNVPIPQSYFASVHQACDKLGCELVNKTGHIPNTTGTYFHQLMTHIEKMSSRQPEPAHFFNSFVSKQSEVGHYAYFQSTTNLAHCFKNAGFKDVHSFVCPTPWFFSSRKNAVWFIHELFAIGDRAAKTPNDVSSVNTELITEGIEHHLGLIDFPDGSCVILWKLMYVWGSAS